MTSGDVKTGEVVKPEDANAGVPVSQTPEFDRFLTTAQADSGDQEIDPFERIIAQILSADTPDAVLTPVEPVRAQDLVGVNLLLHGFDLTKSDYDVGSPFYANMHVERADTGEPLVVNCGHKKVIAQLVKLREFDQFPYQVMLMTRGTSQVGTPMLELRKWVTMEQREPPF